MYMLVKGSGGRAAKMDQHWHKGIFVGILKRSGEAVVLTPEGARKARSIRRVVEEQRYDQELLRQAKGVPWDEDGDGCEGEPSVILPAGVDARPVHDAPITPPVAAESKPFAHRRMYITNDALMKFGFTDGCRACESTLQGKRASGVPHTAECRARIEQAMAADEEFSDRLRQAEARLVGAAVPQAAGAATKKENAGAECGQPRLGAATEQQLGTWCRRFRPGTTTDQHIGSWTWRGQLRPGTVTSQHIFGIRCGCTCPIAAGQPCGSSRRHASGAECG